MATERQRDSQRAEHLPKGQHRGCWQNGYGVFSIGQSQVEDVRAYIAGQEEHHRKISFQEEFRRLLQRYEIAFDERYVWD